MSIEIKNLIIDNVSDEEWEALCLEREALMKRKEREEILSRYEIKPLGGKRKGWWVTVNGKQVKKTNRKDLEDYIVQFNTEQEVTLVNIFNDFCAYKEADGIDEDTLSKYAIYFNKFLKGSELGSKPVKDVTIADGKHFQHHVLAVEPKTKLYYWKNVHYFLNQMFIYAVNELQVITQNPLRELADKPSKDFWYTEESTPKSDLFYSVEERDKIIELAYKDYLKKNNPIPLGILILFCTGIRVGELCGLQWKDIFSDHISIRRQLTGNNKLKPPKSESGIRDILIEPSVYAIFESIRDKNIELGFPVSDDSFVFLRWYKGNIEPCNRRCFNGRLEYYCPKLGIPVKSTHDIRRTSITAMNDCNSNTVTVSAVAGHSDVRMTHQYIQTTNQNVQSMMYNVQSPIAVKWNELECLFAGNKKDANPCNSRVHVQLT